MSKSTSWHTRELKHCKWWDSSHEPPTWKTSILPLIQHQTTSFVNENFLNTTQNLEILVKEKEYKTEEGSRIW